MPWIDKPHLFRLRQVCSYSQELPVPILDRVGAEQREWVFMVSVNDWA